MNLKAAIRVLIVIGITTVFSSRLPAQQIAIDTEELEALVGEWNYAHNARSGEAFKRVYGEKLIFYTQRLTRKICITLKEELFRKNKAFEQRIVSDLVFTAYTSGIIKCDFRKEVFTNGKWKPYPCYLLFSYADNEYKIVGESDYSTDKTLKYSLNIGKPMDIPLASNASLHDVPSNDSLQTDTDTASIALDKPPVMIDSAIATVEAVAEQSLNETVTIPKIFLYALVGIAFLAVIMVIVYKKKSVSGQSNSSIEKRNRSLSQTQIEAFQNFIITLFDPLYFQLTYKSQGIASPGNPDLKFDYLSKDYSSRLAIRCSYLYSANLADVVVDLNDLSTFIKYAVDRNLVPYFILGVGGEPDDPDEIFLIPLKSPTVTSYTYQQLIPFRKAGMFYININTKQLK
jgi:hypothetical protein